MIEAECRLADFALEDGSRNCNAGLNFLEETMISHLARAELQAGVVGYSRLMELDEANTLDLREALRRKVRRAAGTNRVFVPVRQLFPNVA